MQESQINTETVEGKIVLIQFVNKIGEPVPEAFDMYLEFDNQKLFIKLRDGNYSYKDLKKYLDLKMKYKIIRSNGLWDTNDPNVQSRVGDYVVIIDILK